MLLKDDLPVVNQSLRNVLPRGALSTHRPFEGSQELAGVKLNARNDLPHGFVQCPPHFGTQVLDNVLDLDPHGSTLGAKGSGVQP